MPVPQNEEQPAHGVLHGVDVIDAVAAPISLSFDIDGMPLGLIALENIMVAPRCSGAVNGRVCSANPSICDQVRDILFSFATTFFRS